MDWLDLLAVQGTLKSLLQHHSSKASILWCLAFFIVQLSHPYMTTGKIMPLTRWTFVGKIMSLLFNRLSRLHSSHALVKKCSKFFNSGFSNMWTMNFQMFKLLLKKAEEPEIKLPTSAGSSKKQESSRKTSISALQTMPKALTVWITINYGTFWKRWEYQTTWPGSWEICMQVRKQQLELEMEEQTGSK